MNTIKNLSSEAKINLLLIILFLPVVAYGITKVVQAVANGASTYTF